MTQKSTVLSKNLLSSSSSSSVVWKLDPRTGSTPRSSENPFAERYLSLIPHGREETHSLCLSRPLACLYKSRYQSNAVSAKGETWRNEHDIAAKRITNHLSNGVVKPQPFRRHTPPSPSSARARKKDIPAVGGWVALLRFACHTPTSPHTTRTSGVSGVDVGWCSCRVEGSAIGWRWAEASGCV